MAVLWLCRKLGVSRCPVWHNKAKPKSVAHRSDHKSGKVPEACTAKVDKRDESQGTVRLANNA